MAERYWKEPERYRREASAYQREHRELVNARLRSWYARNLDKQRAYNRESQRKRSLIRAPRGNVKDPYLLVLRRDPCSYCGGKGGTLDHIDPVSNGGGHTWDNLAGACRSCNSQKHDAPLLTALLRRGNGH